jgi:two-component system chemotaxis sensor kinase CheA
MDDILKEFLTEATEMLSQLDTELVELERSGGNPELVRSIFRIIHTIKGTCGFVGLSRLEKVAHAAENVLGKIRDGELVVSPAAITAVLEAVDRIKMILAGVESTGAEPEGDDAPLVAELARIAAGEGGEAAAANAAPAAAPAPAEDAAPASEEAAAPQSAAPAEPAEAAAPDAQAAPAKPAPAEPARSPARVERAATETSSVAAQTIRVNVAVLEHLMTEVSELVLTRNQLLQTLRSNGDSAFAAPLQRLSQVTSELQDSVMKTRMQPIGTVWSKLPRLVRDLGRELGKKIELVMHGQETELDRQVLEMIRDPLTHMVRNSADHGIELPAERVAAGKPESGTISLDAYHRGGHIIIEIADDGKGLSAEKIRKKALENGIVSAEELASMSEQQIQQLIFRAGLSTAQQVTSVSGRGVGMDVVRTNIEKIGGAIEMQSKEGEGTRFLVRIPLTLAIVAALIVECAGERFAIPQIGVRELVRVGPTSPNKVEQIHDALVLRLRDRLLPLASLRALLGLGEPETASDERFVVVAEVGTENFGIIVDRVFDTEEIVVKPVAPVLRELNVFSGNTILGDGSVVMILDLNNLMSLNSGISGDQTTHVVHATSSVAAEDDRTALLVFRAGGDTRKAVPLARVARLEQLATDTFETVDGAIVVQYRGRLMPLVALEGDPKMPEQPRQQVIVFADSERSVGVLVDEIVDIIEDRLDIELTDQRAGMLGTAVIGGKATEIVDVDHVLRRVSDQFTRSGESGDARARLDALYGKLGIDMEAA